MVEEKVSLYFHIPFCTKKCPYCHFYVVPNRLPYHQLLKESLAAEWEQQLPLLQNKTITSIYFGGGTPALFPHIDALLAKIPYTPNTEITLEANPEESSLPLFEHFRSLGINRLSLGVQSLDDRSLQTLERIHSAERARQAIFQAYQAGFTNISIDLMYDLPDQTEESWRYTLSQIGSLPIQHLSLYNLTIEPHTPFFKRRIQTPPPELSLRLLNAALTHLDSIGLHRYEISAFSHPNYESRHNLGYWTARPFLGFGPSAFSYWNGERFRNIANLHRYARLVKEGQSPVDFREKLAFPDNHKERLTIQLRTLAGIELSTLPLPSETYTALRKLHQQGLIHLTDTHARLTERGTLFYDTVAADLI